MSRFEFQSSEYGIGHADHLFAFGTANSFAFDESECEGHPWPNLRNCRLNWRFEVGPNNVWDLYKQIKRLKFPTDKSPFRNEELETYWKNARTLFLFSPYESDLLNIHCSFQLDSQVGHFLSAAYARSKSISASFFDLVFSPQEGCLAPTPLGWRSHGEPLFSDEAPMLSCADSQMDWKRT